MNKKIISLLLSIIVIFFLVLKFNVSSFISILLLITSFIAIYFTITKKEKKYNKFSIVLSIIFSLIYVLCDSIENNYMLDIFNKYLALNISGYFIIFYISFVNLFDIMDKYIKKNKEDKKIYIGYKEIFTTSRFSFIINFLLIFIINLIFLLKFYPGNLTYDSFNEIEQIKGIFPLMNNHSILHTGILAIFVKFGLLLKNINIGIFLFSLFQIIIVSLIFSYIMRFLAKHNVPIIFRILSLIFFMHPINVFYSFSIWKDILFSICFVIFTILIYYFSKDENYFMDKKNIFLFIVMSLLVMYLRNNGIYIIIISLIILFIMYRKKYKRLIPIFLGIIFTFFISKILIFNVLNINDFEVKEMLSFPSQSLARVYKYDKDKLTKKEIKQIERFYSNKVGEAYNPIVSDNTKNLLDQKYLLKHKGEYFKLNFKLFFKYNKRYVESFISNNYGYYYINTNYPSIILQKSDLYGVKHVEIFNNFVIYCILVVIITSILLVVLWNLKEKQNILLLSLLLPVVLSLDTNIKTNPLIYMFFNIGLYVTIAFILFVYNKKNKKNVTYYIPTIVLWVSMLFSPVYSEFRYLYPLFLLIPVFIGLTFKEADK